MNKKENDLIEPTKPEIPSNYDIIFGQHIAPIERLKTFSPDQFEDVVNEWIDGYLKEEYALVYKAGGSGDKGRDVIGYVKEDIQNGEWDNYQCKHYDHPLYPGDIWIELGKLCYYTYNDEYTVPRKYYFISPLGIGSKLNEYIESPSKLKRELIENWDKKCKKKITQKEDVKLKGEFLNYVKEFDFSIITHCPPQTFIEQLSTTKWFKFRFGGGLSKHRPEPNKPSEDIKKKEVRYVEQLFEAYSDHLDENIGKIDKIKKYEYIYDHFNRQREDFYKAESLRRFVRDEMPDDELFASLQKQIYRGVIDVTLDDHKDGFKCVRETTKEAKKLQITNNLLVKYITGDDRGGMCHQLANKDKLKWVKDNG